VIETKQDVTIAFITTQMKWGSEYDVPLYPSDINGLKRYSLIRLNKLATIDKELILGRLGSIGESEMKLLNMNLYKIFQLT